mgnify:CR=1 FL=1
MLKTGVGTVARPVWKGQRLACPKPAEARSPSVLQTVQDVQLFGDNMDDFELHGHGPRSIHVAAVVSSTPVRVRP